jgi:hypothetical protein
LESALPWKKLDKFSIDLTLTHESLDPADISGSLAMRPSLSAKADERAHRASLWQSVLAGGSEKAEFLEALKTADFSSGSPLDVS